MIGAYVIWTTNIGQEIISYFIFSYADLESRIWYTQWNMDMYQQYINIKIIANFSF